MITLRNGKDFPPKWLTFVCLMALLLGVGSLVLDKYTATQDRNTAQSNTATLAQDIARMCSEQGRLMVDDRDLCAKATQVQQNPTEAIPGPKGDTGSPGRDGAVGLDGRVGAQGEPGKDGLPGPPGAQGAAGMNGADSTVAGPPGPQGLPGTDSTVPGPAGAQGETGPAGDTGTSGKSPTSFTFTDKTGTTYTCTPNPPGSSTYTCASDGKLP